MSNEGGIFKAAGLIAIITIISKFIGFFRDIIIAKYFGASLVSDAYFYAYQIPSVALLILGGVGGPFHSATVAVFSKFIDPCTNKPNEKAINLFRTFATISGLFFIIISILVFAFSDVIINIIINGGKPELISLASTYLKIMSPIMILGGIIGIYYGLLVSHKKFMLPNLSPTVMSLIIICAIIATRNHSTGLVLAVATTIGAFCQLVMQIPSVSELGYKFRPNFDFLNNIELNQIGELLFPAVLSSSIGQVHIYIDMFFASQLQEGVWTAIGYANRVFQFPLGVLVTAFLVPLFPLFAKLVSQKEYGEVTYYFRKGIGMLNFLGVPVVFLIALLGFDGIRLVFERGAFDGHATVLVSEALFYLSLGLIPYVFRDSVTRVFYSFNDSKTPFLIALTSILAKVFFNYIFINVLGFGIGGITFSTTLVTLFNATALGILILKKIKLDYKNYFIDLIKMCIICVICYCSVHPLVKLWQVDDPKLLTAKVLTLTLAFMVLYLLLALPLKIEYAKLLCEKIKAALKI